MKTKPRLSRKYVSYGAIPKKEYNYGSDNPTIEPPFSPAEGTASEEKIIVNHTPLKLSVKIRLLQQFRQNRASGQKPSGTSLGWRTKWTLRRNAGSDNRR